MPQALPLTTKISQSSTNNTKYRTLSASYGDGYSESRPDGINDVIDTVNISYENLSPTDKATVMAVINSVKGSDYVTWTNVLKGDVTASKFKIDMTQGVSINVTAGNRYNISFSMSTYNGF